MTGRITTLKPSTPSITRTPFDTHLQPPALTMQEIFRLSEVRRSRREARYPLPPSPGHPIRPRADDVSRETCAPDWSSHPLPSANRAQAFEGGTTRRHCQIPPERVAQSQATPIRPARSHPLTAGRAVHHRGQDVRPPSTPRASPNAVSRGTRMPTLERPSRQRRPQRATRRVHADTPAIQLTTPQGSSCSSKPRPTCPTSRRHSIAVAFAHQ
jgi:hypothetical protein